ncbi:MAG: alpha/beta hydrolase, partial [Frankiaceae bacterium]|nr:alpha/beta hydrolase [Frankiaceae bacterium]
MSDTAPVLLVHGLASSFEHNWKIPGWVDLLEAEGRQVIGVDLPGHGPHPADPSATDPIAVIADAIAGHDRVDAVGFSMGAHLLLRLAGREPARFAKLVTIGVGNAVVDPDGGGGGAGSSGMRAEAFLDDTSEDAVSQLFMRMLRSAGNDLEQVRGFLAYARAHPAEPARVRDIACPALVVIGDQDFAAPADQLAAAIP